MTDINHGNTKIRDIVLRIEKFISKIKKKLINQNLEMGLE